MYISLFFCLFFDICYHTWDFTDGESAGMDPGFVLGRGIFEAESCRRSTTESYEWSEPFAAKRALETFGFLMFKYAFSHILETYSLIF